MTGVFLAISLFLILVAVGVRDPKSCLYFAVFMSPWSGVAIDIGLQVSAYSVAIASFAVAVLFQRSNRRLNNSTAIAKNPWLWAYILYAVMYSLAQVLWLPNLSVSGGGARTPQIRALAQVVMFLLTISPLLLVPLVLKKPAEITKCANTYIWSVTLLALLGFIQLIIWYSSGTNPFPIGLVNAHLTGLSTDILRSGIDHVGSFSVYRMNSFGGEPKGLATGLAVGLLILQAGYSANLFARNRKIGKRMLGIYLFLFTALILTWSTSGAFLWLIGTVTLSISGIGMTRRGRGNKNLIVGVATVLVVLGGFYAITQPKDSSESVFADYANKRFVERNPIEDSDEAILEFLRSEPKYIFLGVGLGNVHLYARSYVPSYALFYMGKTAFIAKSGYLRIASELGLVGLVLFAAMLFWWLSALRREQRLYPQGQIDQQLAMVLYSLGLVMFMGGMARVYIWPQMFFVFGLCSAYPGILNNERRRRAVVRHGSDMRH